MPILYTTATWFAVSSEWTALSATPVESFRLAAGALSEPPKRSRWLSCANVTAKGPRSHLAPPDTRRGLRLLATEMPASVGLPIEYCTLVCSPPRIVGEVKSTAFARRKLKLEAELAPKPVFCNTLLCDTKLPLLTPRKPSMLPYSLYGVSILPSLNVPHPSLVRPANELRVAKLVVWFPSSMLTCCSSCQIADDPRPICLSPRKPR